MASPAVQWLTPDEQRSWRAYLQGTTLFTHALAQDHEARSPVSLNEYAVLVQLSESPEYTARMSALAEGLSRSRSRMTHTVARMEARGLVSRCSSDGDRRGVNCRLTEAGHQVLVEAAPLHVAAVRRYLVDVLSPDEFQALGKALHAIAQACQDGGAPASDSLRP